MKLCSYDISLNAIKENSKTQTITNDDGGKKTIYMFVQIMYFPPNRSRYSYHRRLIIMSSDFSCSSIFTSHFVWKNMDFMLEREKKKEKVVVRFCTRQNSYDRHISSVCAAVFWFVLVICNDSCDVPFCDFELPIC